MSMSSSSSLLFERALTIVRRFTRPFDISAETDDYRRAQLLATFILAHLLVGSVMLSIRLITGYAYSSATTLGVVAYTLLLVAFYAFSRTRHFRLVAMLYILAFYVFLLGLALVDVSAPADRTLNLTIIPVLLASLTLTVGTTIGVGLTGAGMIVLLPLIAPNYPHELAPLLRFHLFVSMLIVISAWVRQRDYNNLQESENRYRDLMDATMESIIISDHKGYILDCNPSFEQLVKVPVQDLQGRQMLSFVIPDSHDGIRLWFRNRETDLYETKIVNAKGKLRDVEILARTCTYRGRSARVTVARDITQRKISESQRREYEMRYRALFEQTVDAVFIFDLKGTLLSANEQASRMLRAPLDQLIGQSFEQYVLEDDNSASRERIKRLRRGERVPVYERRFRRDDDDEFIGEVSLTLVHDEENERQYVQAIVRDVNERKNSEQQAFELALQQERVKVLQKFISDASHHFRTPLANLNTASYLLQRFQDNPYKQRHQFSVIRSEIKRLDQLLEDLLTVIRLEKESSEYITQIRFSVNDLLKERIAVIQREYEDKHDWEVLPYRDLMLRGNPYRLGQAISLVLDNAARYTPAGGRVISRCYEREGHIVVEVKDSGIGIPEQDQPHIFEYFYRTDNARDVDASRNGLGLSISRKIIEMHHGRVEIGPVNGQMGGTIVRLILPASPANQREPDPIERTHQ